MDSYAPACIKLLAQYKSLMKLVAEEIGSLEAFMKRFKVSQTLARRDQAWRE
jgi:ESCRT-I complex subunit VPS28